MGRADHINLGSTVDAVDAAETDPSVDHETGCPPTSPVCQNFFAAGHRGRAHVSERSPENRRACECVCSLASVGDQPYVPLSTTECSC